MTVPVRLTDGAARDLDELFAAAMEAGGPPHADLIVDRIRTCLARIASDAAGGGVLPELRALGVRDALEVREGGLRVVYRNRPDGPAVALIAQEGRSMQALLQRRMLDA